MGDKSILDTEKTGKTHFCSIKILIVDILQTLQELNRSFWNFVWTGVSFKFEPIDKLTPSHKR